MNTSGDGGMMGTPGTVVEHEAYLTDVVESNTNRNPLISRQHPE
jgi:hypothetical protein